MKLTLLLIFAIIAAAISVSAKGGNAFSLPQIDGYKNSAYHLRHNTLDPPIIKQLKVLKPLEDAKSRSELESEFKDFFTAQNWKVQNESNGYTEFTFSLYNEDDQYGYTHATGRCEVWIPEGADLITIYQYQWRISRFHPETVRRLNRIKERIGIISKATGFSIVETDISDWPSFYANENLIEYQAYSLNLAKDQPRHLDSHPTKGRVVIRLLGYRTDLDANLALDSRPIYNTRKKIRSKNIIVILETRDDDMLTPIESISDNLDLSSITGETQREWERKTQNQAGDGNSE